MHSIQEAHESNMKITQKKTPTKPSQTGVSQITYSHTNCTPSQAKHSKNRKHSKKHNLSLNPQSLTQQHPHTPTHCTHGTCGVLDRLLFCDQTRPNLRISLVGYHCAI